MCIAIVKPAGATITKETLGYCHDRNPDGCGFAYVNVDRNGKRKLRTRKDMEFESFYRKLEKAISKNPESPFLIHFRIKTHGKIDLANCHPFMVDRNHVFIHNGTISGVGSDLEKSDTRLFNESVLRVLPKNWNQNSGIKKLIEEFISYSKLAVLNLDGEVNIYNENKGEWVDGVWYSNSSYKKPVKTKKYKAKTNSGYQDWWKKNTTSAASHVGASNSRVVTVNPRTYDENTYVPCDYCGKHSRVYDMEAYYQYQSAMCFCQTCANRSETWDQIDMEDMLSPECFVDYLNQNERYHDDDDHKSYLEWENPWRDEIGESNMEEVSMEEYNEEIEVCEGAYALAQIT